MSSGRTAELEKQDCFSKSFSAGEESPLCSMIADMAEKICEGTTVSVDENQLYHKKCPVVFVSLETITGSSRRAAALSGWRVRTWNI